MISTSAAPGLGLHYISEVQDRHLSTGACDTRVRVPALGHVRQRERGAMYTMHSQVTLNEPEATIDFTICVGCLKEEMYVYLNLDGTTYRNSSLAEKTQKSKNSPPSPLVPRRRRSKAKRK